MKLRYLIIYILIFIILGAVICIKIANGDGSGELVAKTTEINRLLISVEKNWDDISTKNKEKTETYNGIDYSVINTDMKVLLKTRDDISISVSSATTHYDVIRDIEVDGNVVGKLIVHNPSAELKQERNRRYAMLVALMLTVMLIVLVIYSIYIRTAFAKRVFRRSDTQISLWKVIPYELIDVWYNIRHYIRYLKADKNDFSSHKV